MTISEEIKELQDSWEENETSMSVNEYTSALHRLFLKKKHNTTSDLTYEAKVFYRKGYNRIVVGYILINNNRLIYKRNSDRMRLVKSMCTNGGYKLFSSAVDLFDENRITVKNLFRLEKEWNNIIGLKVSQIDVECTDEVFKKLYEKI